MKLWPAPLRPATMPPMNARVASLRSRFYWRDGRMAAMVGVVILLATIAVAGVKVFSRDASSNGKPPSAFVGPPPAATPAPTPTPDPVKAAIIQGYRNATAAFVHAATTMNPNDPAIPATAVGAEEVIEVANLQKDASLHIIMRGDIKIGKPHVDSVVPGKQAGLQQAQLTDCRLSDLNAYDVRTGVLVNARTGEPFPGRTPGPPEAELVTATLGGPLDGVWKVLDEKVQTVASCPPT